MIKQRWREAVFQVLHLDRSTGFDDLQVTAERMSRLLFGGGLVTTSEAVGAMVEALYQVLDATERFPIDALCHCHEHDQTCYVPIEAPPFAESPEVARALAVFGAGPCEFDCEPRWQTERPIEGCTFDKIVRWTYDTGESIVGAFNFEDLRDDDVRAKRITVGLGDGPTEWDGPGRFVGWSMLELIMQAGQLWPEPLGAA